MSLMNDFNEISSEIEAWFTFFEIFILGFAVCWVIIVLSLRKEKTYKQGQIDALNDKIYYEKQENEDKEIIWVEKQNKI